MAVSQNLTLTQSSQDATALTSKVRILWTSTQTDDSFNSYKRTAKYYVSVNGGAEVEYSVSYTLPKNKTQTIVDTTITVKHTADGKGSVKVRTWMDTDISAGEVVQIKTLTLTTIPRGTTPSLSASQATMGDTVTITMNRASDGFTHDLAYSIRGGVFTNIATGVGESYSWKVPDLAEEIPKASSAVVTIRCITKSGSTSIGTKSVQLTVKVPTTSAYMPSVEAITVAEATADLSAQIGAFVKNKSTFAVSIEAVGGKGATITSYKTKIDGIYYTGSSFTSKVITASGSVRISVEVTDSRGRGAIRVVQVNVLNYFLPVITEFLAYRVDENGVADSSGKFLSVAYAYKVAPLNNKNTASMKIQQKKTTATSWSTALLTGTDLNGSGVVQFTEEFTPDYQFDIRLTVVDRFGAEAKYIATLPTANVIFDIRAQGDGFAFGKTSERPGLEVKMPADGKSIHMIGVHSYEIGNGFGHILYNNGLLLQWGVLSIQPTALDTVTSVNVLFPIPYKSRPHISGTILVNSPQVVNWSMGAGTSLADGVNGLMIYMVRQTMHATPFRWMAFGFADMTAVTEVTAE